MKKMTPSYFINPDIDALATATPEQRSMLVRKIAACVGDECALRSVIGINPEEFRNFYPDMLPTNLSTDDTISSFISIFSSEKKAATPEVENLVEEACAAPAIDYALTIDEDSESGTADGPRDMPSDYTSDMISSFLEAVPPKIPARKRMAPVHAAVQNPEPKPDPTPGQGTDAGVQSPELSEALFRLMVKNKNYAKALEIIQELSLNNPKKSVYFATQIRFLKKLIQIEGYKAR